MVHGVDPIAGDRGYVEPIDDYIGQHWDRDPGIRKKRKERDRRLFKIAVVLIVLLGVVPLVSIGGILWATSVECTLTVSVKAGSSSLSDYYVGMFIIVDHNGLLGGRVGSDNTSAASGTFTTSFNITRTGEYEVMGGLRTPTGSVFMTEFVDVTRDDDGNTVQVDIDMS